MSRSSISGIVKEPLSMSPAVNVIMRRFSLLLFSLGRDILTVDAILDALPNKEEISTVRLIGRFFRNK